MTGSNAPCANAAILVRIRVMDVTRIGKLLNIIDTRIPLDWTFGDEAYGDVRVNDRGMPWLVIKKNIDDRQSAVGRPFGLWKKAWEDLVVEMDVSYDDGATWSEMTDSDWSRIHAKRGA